MPFLGNSSAKTVLFVKKKSDFLTLLGLHIDLNKNSVQTGCVRVQIAWTNIRNKVLVFPINFKMEFPIAILVHCVHAKIWQVPVLGRYTIGTE